MTAKEKILKIFKNQRLEALVKRDEIIDAITSKTSRESLLKSTAMENASTVAEDCDYEGDPLPEGFLSASKIWDMMDSAQRVEVETFRKTCLSAGLEYTGELHEILIREETALRDIGATRTV